mmetsp:Transcript_35810/g.93350  ORF Transcript_35810/g.93350 Transcript_35810/m.93350 type:complete len:577 (-) Transcript_35810:309-2039(-)
MTSILLSEKFVKLLVGVGVGGITVYQLYRWASSASSSSSSSSDNPPKPSQNKVDPAMEGSDEALRKLVKTLADAPFPSDRKGKLEKGTACLRQARSYEQEGSISAAYICHLFGAALEHPFCHFELSENYTEENVKIKADNAVRDVLTSELEGNNNPLCRAVLAFLPYFGVGMDQNFVKAVGDMEQLSDDYPVYLLPRFIVAHALYSGRGKVRNALKGINEIRHLAVEEGMYLARAYYVGALFSGVEDRQNDDESPSLLLEPNIEMAVHCVQTYVDEEARVLAEAIGKKDESDREIRAGHLLYNPLYSAFMGAALISSFPPGSPQWSDGVLHCLHAADHGEAYALYFIADLYLSAIDALAEEEMRCCAEGEESFQRVENGEGTVYLSVLSSLPPAEGTRFLHGFDEKVLALSSRGKLGSVDDTQEYLLSLLALAADKGLPEALHDLGLRLCMGNGIAKNVEIGLKKLWGAARKEFTPAFETLASLFARGEVVERDMKKAAKLLEDAIKLGSADALALYSGNETVSLRQLGTFQSIMSMVWNSSCLLEFPLLPNKMCENLFVLPWISYFFPLQKYYCK